MRRLFVFAALLFACQVCLAQGRLEVFNLKWADAGTVAAMFSAEPPPAEADLNADRQEWVSDFAGRVARQLPRDPNRVEPRWHYASGMTTSPREQIGRGQSGSMARFLPPGLDAPPIVLMGQNAVVARGTQAALDQLREIITMLDVKPKMVNVEVRLQDAPNSQTNEWGIEGARQFGDLLLATRGNAPAAGLQMRSRRGNEDTTAGWDRTRSSGDTLTSANLTTTSSFPAIITVGRLIPYVSSSVTYSPYGDRIVTTQVDAVFIGAELFVQPRVNANDTVTMILRPTFIEAVGTVIGPNGVSLPITATVGTATQVTVPDGQTLQIGGFERSLGEYGRRFGGLLMGRQVRVDSHPAMFVTPRIIRDLEPGFAP